MTLRAPAARPSRGVLAITSFRRLWISLSLASLGDWLSILALTALASSITADQSFSAQSYAVGGVFILRLMPAVVLGPLAGAFADRFDRRVTMVVSCLARAVLLASIPLVGRLAWLFIATFLVECVALFWTPAKDASVPRIVPPDKLERANQLSLMSTYGTAPLAAVLFSLLALINTLVGEVAPIFKTNQAYLAIYINAVTFLIAALVIWNLRDLSRPDERHISVPSVLRQITEGWGFVGRTPIVRGLAVGILGSCAAAGAVIAVAKPYTSRLGGGDAAWGVLFGTIFVGMAVGMFLGPRLLSEFSRHRLFGLSIVASGLALALIALIPNLVIVVLLTLAVGAGAGVAWVIAYTLLGLEVDDALRGRTFAFVQSLIRIVLLLVLAAAPLLSGLIGSHPLGLGRVTYRVDGANLVLLLAAVIAVTVGLLAFRQMDDRRGIPLWGDLAAALRGVPYAAEERPEARGVLIAFEGGEAAGKTTQARLLAIALRDQGYDVVATHEPGATKLGMRLRAILLDRSHHGLAPRAEALLYAADRAEHVAAVIRPALDRGAIVITDRYVDSSLAYQGAGRDLPVEDVARLNKWATAGLGPDLTVILDVPADVGRSRHASPADRMEAEPPEFHERVRRGFRLLAETEPDRYLVLDGTRPQGELSREICDRVREILPDPVPSVAEDVTSTFPAIRD